MNIGWQIPVVHPIDTTRLPMKTTPTTTATVTVTLIAAFLSPAMRLVNAWNLPWRFLKFAIANRKILDTIPENCLEGKWQSTKEIFIYFFLLITKITRVFANQDYVHHAAPTLEVCISVPYWLYNNKGQKRVFSFAIDNKRIPKCQAYSMLYPLSMQCFYKPLIALNMDFPHSQTQDKLGHSFRTDIY